jgi:flagellin
MATRINTNVGAMLATLNLNKSFQNAQNSIAKLSSGMRIYRAGDDPGGLTIWNKLTSDQTAWDQAARNANEGIAALQVADSGAAQQAVLLNSMKALAEQAASGTSTSASRIAANASFKEMKSEVATISSTVKYGEIEVLNGDLNGVEFHTGISSNASVTLSFTHCTKTDLNSLGGTTTNMMVISATSTSAAQSAIGLIDAAIKSVGIYRGDIGSMQNMLENAASVASSAAVNTASAASAIGDVDFATEVANFTQSSILAQAGIAFMAQANLLNQSVLALIG